MCLCLNLCHLVAAGLYGSHQILDIVLILRVLRLVRVVDSVQRFVCFKLLGFVDGL